jgi:hypothetical protein
MLWMVVSAAVSTYSLHEHFVKLLFTKKSFVDLRPPSRFARQAVRLGPSLFVCCRKGKKDKYEPQTSVPGLV